MSDGTSKPTRRQFVTGAAVAAGLYGVWHRASGPALAGEMQMRIKSLVTVTLAFWMMVSVGYLDAQERGAAGPPIAYVEPLGVPLAPPMYLVNFLLMYFSNPEIAAYMPAYRAPLPQEVYKCLVEHPDGCPYADMEPYFVEQALNRGGSQNKASFWPSHCQADPRWQALAPPKYRYPEQINQPLGAGRAEQLARLLGIDEDIILTDGEYQCLIGAPPRDLVREIIFDCSNDLSNSKGNATTPLSSYGLSFNERGDVRSNCAPHAPCLDFNMLFLGPLEMIAKNCGFADKLERLVTETPFQEFANQASLCQDAGKPSCIVEAACPGNGAQSNNSCAAPLAPQ